MRFSKKVTENTIKPKDGQPLTVVEFSLTDDIRGKLAAALRPYVEGKEDDREKLGEIIDALFPSEVLAELQRFAHTKHASTVYVVKNLPEIEKESIPPSILHNQQKEVPIVSSFNGQSNFYEYINQWFDAHSYQSYIGEGLCQALNLKTDSTFALARYHNNDQEINGYALHKHDKEVTMLGGIVSDQAPTRFTDVKAMVDEARKDKHLASMHIEGHMVGRSLGAIPKDEPLWRRAIGCALMPEHASDEPRFEALASKHSQHVVLGKGDLVIWANDGKVFHQALPGKADSWWNWVTRKKDLARAVFGREIPRK